MDKTQQVYKTLNEIPADELAGRVVGSIILAKGNLNLYKAIVENLIAELRKDFTEHAHPQIEAEARAAVVEDAAQAIRYYLKYQNIPNWEDANEYERAIEVACKNVEEIVSALASAPPGHVCVPVDDLDAPYALLKNIADNIRDEAPFRDQYIHKCKIIVGMIDGLLAARTK